MKKLYYSLTGRGFYSEIINLLLAIIYCEKNNIEIVINTKYWNSRLKEGWTDYFKPTLNCTNQFVSSQLYFNGSNHQITLRGLYYNPFRELNHLMQCNINYLYKKSTKNLLTDDIVSLMRDPNFVYSMGTNDYWLNEFSNKLSQIYKYNDILESDINNYKAAIGISKLNYIGVHIRRGDKIKSKEMNDIQLDVYIQAILKKNHISKNVYIATDDISIIDEMKIKLGNEYNIYYNLFLNSQGFDESKFNKMNRSQSNTITKLAILDVDILSNSTHFIGTYSSNLSRIIPCFKGLSSCESIDIPWNPIF